MIFRNWAVSKAISATHDERVFHGICAITVLNTWRIYYHVPKVFTIQNVFNGKQQVQKSSQIVMKIQSNTKKTISRAYIEQRYDVNLEVHRFLIFWRCLRHNLIVQLLDTDAENLKAPIPLLFNNLLAKRNRKKNPFLPESNFRWTIFH